jgi:glycosyltransferase involved in cell wall biosynthesis
MNIALLIEQKFDQFAGGVQRSTSKLAKIFKTNGHNVIIISLSNLQNDKIVDGIEIFSAIKDQKEDFDKLKKLVIIHNIRIVINQAGYSIQITKLLLRLRKQKKFKILNTLRINPLNFITNHELFINQFLDAKGLSFLNSKLLRLLVLKYHKIKQAYELNYIIKHIDAFVMLSERFKPELFFLAPSLKKLDSKIHGIGNPFERPEIDINRLEKENIILFVGRLNILQKRVDLLLQIWKKLHKECTDWKFWVVGDGESKTFMEDFCEEHQLDRVTFFGKDNPNDYYKKAKIFHMTSAFEGFGNVLVEAQSYGCVSVLFNTYAAAEDIVTQNENGILVKPLNVEEYVEQTMLLINNPSILNQLSANAFENVLRFSYEETYKKWDAVFKSINSQDKK